MCRCWSGVLAWWLGFLFVSKLFFAGRVGLVLVEVYGGGHAPPLTLSKHGRSARRNGMDRVGVSCHVGGWGHETYGRQTRVGFKNISDSPMPGHGRISKTKAGKKEKARKLP